MTGHDSTPAGPVCGQPATTRAGWTLRARDTLMHLRATAPDDPERGQLEAFVASVFNARHGARISSFMPGLIGARSGGGEIQAVVGMREAAGGPLFLEQYTDGPVEGLIRRRLGERVSRHHIVEVGNLAVHRHGSARLLIQFLCLHLVASGYTWVVFTGTRHVLHAFRRLGLSPRPLCAADPARLLQTGDQWGRYYDNDPRVMAGFIPDGFPAVSPEIFRPSELRCLLARAEATLVAAGCLDGGRASIPYRIPKRGIA